MQGARPQENKGLKKWLVTGSAGIAALSAALAGLDTVRSSLSRACEAVGLCEGKVETLAVRDADIAASDKSQAVAKAA